MGTLLRGKCPGCGLEGTFTVGGGLQDCRPETALQAGRNDPDLAAALQAGCRFQIKRIPATCSNCRKLMTASQVTWWTAEGQECCTLPPCPDCGGALLRYPAGSQSVICPVCGEKIPLEPAGHWD